MVMSWVFSVFLFISVISAAMLDTAGAVSAAVIQGAQAGITLAISLAGSLCLWSGVGHLMERIGITTLLSRLMMPVLGRLFPDIRRDSDLAGALSSNVCANILGLGNAATPMGIRAARCMVDPDKPGVATDQLCRLIVLNTASIQLIPANVAAIRVSLGCPSPFDILPAVWLTSLGAAGMGLGAAWLFGKLMPND